MSTNLLSKAVVLHLNRLWQPLGHITVEQAINKIFSVTEDGQPSAVALAVDYPVLPNGELDFAGRGKPYPVSVEEWMKLPIRSIDFALGTSRGPIRMPTIVISTGYDEMPIVQSKKCTKRRIRERDGGICQFTGDRIERHEGNVEHLTPLHAGGKTTYENCVWVKRTLNSMKGGKSLKESGFKLIRKPTAPKPVPLCAKVREVRHPDQRVILKAVA